MTPEEHKQRHIELHRKCDELLADFMTHNENKYPSQTTVWELMNWSHEQTKNPTEPK